MFQTEIHPWHVLLASCPWGPVTALGVSVLTEMYVIYMETYTIVQCFAPRLFMSLHSNTLKDAVRSGMQEWPHDSCWGQNWLQGLFNMVIFDLLLRLTDPSAPLSWRSPSVWYATISRWSPDQGSTVRFSRPSSPECNEGRTSAKYCVNWIQQ